MTEVTVKLEDCQPGMIIDEEHGVRLDDPDFVNSMLADTETSMEEYNSMERQEQISFQLNFTAAPFVVYHVV